MMPLFFFVSNCKGSCEVKQTKKQTTFFFLLQFKQCDVLTPSGLGSVSSHLWACKDDLCPVMSCYDDLAPPLVTWKCVNSSRSEYFGM